MSPRNFAGLVWARGATRSLVPLLCAACGATATGPRGQPDARGDETPFETGHPSGDLTSPAADAGAAPSPIACPPAPTHYAMNPYVPAVAHQGLCTPTEIARFIAECVDPGTSFVAWSHENITGYVDGGAGTPCGNCLFAPPTENNGGMWTDPLAQFEPNYAGCMQLVDPTYGAACAPAFNAATGCEAVACDYCPDVGDNDYTDCVHAADTTVCASVVAAEESACANAFLSGGALDTCSPDKTGNGVGNYSYIATLICGANPADGGLEAGADAPGD